MEKDEYVIDPSNPEGGIEPYVEDVEILELEREKKRKELQAKIAELDDKIKKLEHDEKVREQELNRLEEELETEKQKRLQLAAAFKERLEKEQEKRLQEKQDSEEDYRQRRYNFKERTFVRPLVLTTILILYIVAVFFSFGMLLADARGLMDVHIEIQKGLVTAIIVALPSFLGSLVAYYFITRQDAEDTVV